MDEPTITPAPSAAPPMEAHAAAPDVATVTTPAATVDAATVTAPTSPDTFAVQAAEQAEIARLAAATATQARDLGLTQGKVLEQTATAYASELAKLSALRVEIEAERNAARAHVQTQARLAYLREAGLRDDIPAEDVAILAPQVDASTTEGRAKLDAWRSSRLGLFRQVESPMEVAKRQEETTSRAAKLAAKHPIIGDLLGRHLRRVQ